MGYLQASEMARLAPGDMALRWHLTANHYPPLPESLIPVAKRVIKLALADRLDDEVRLPKGITWRGQSKVPVRVAVESWHLEAFLEEDEG